MQKKELIDASAAVEQVENAIPSSEADAGTAAWLRRRFALLDGISRFQQLNGTGARLQ